MKLESRNSGEMKRVYELDVYKPAEALSDMVWHDLEETKSWLRKLIRTKDLSESSVTEKPNPILNSFIDCTKG
ncbi:MAG: hypothetical protein JRI92_05060 [Deltaproteobacteria bacterium]|nr:hypothetical protein [Deltaproteobacteria bacterium]